MDQYEKLSGPTFDVLASMKLVAEKALPYLKMSHPLSHLVFTYIENFAQKPTEAVIAAINDLTARVERGFDRMVRVMTANHRQSAFLSFIHELRMVYSRAFMSHLPTYPISWLSVRL